MVVPPPPPPLVDIFQQQRGKILRSISLQVPDQLSCGVKLVSNPEKEAQNHRAGGILLTFLKLLAVLEDFEDCHDLFKNLPLHIS